MGLDFFKQYGGQRLSAKDGQSIESGMTTDHLREESERYERMLELGLRPDGAWLTQQDREDVERQANRFAAEIARRRGSK